MQLWIYWFEAIWLVRPACSRLKTLMWFTVCVAGLTIRFDPLDVTSIIRALGIHEKYYQNLLDNFHSPGINLSLMTALWQKLYCDYFPIQLWSTVVWFWSAPSISWDIQFRRSLC